MSVKSLHFSQVLHSRLIKIAAFVWLALFFISPDGYLRDNYNKCDSANFYF